MNAHQDKRISCPIMFILCAVFCVTSCKSRGFPPSAVNSDLQEMSWIPCAIPSIPSLNIPEGVAIECATVKVPLDWDTPDGSSIDYLLRKVRSTRTDTVKTQIWYSEGGPGIPAGPTALRFATEVSADPTLEIYVPDQRGVGASTKLGCGLPVDLIPYDRLPPGEFQKCIDAVKLRWGDRLKFFSTNSAAQDAIEVSKRIRSPDARFFFQGQSYGSYLTNEIMHLAPELPSGWILTGYAPGGWIAYQENRAAFQAITAVLSRLCEGSALCMQKLGKSPEKALVQGLNSVKDGRCSLGSDFAELRKFLSDFSQSEGAVISLFPVIAYRLKRCNDGDTAFIRALLALAAPAPGTTQGTGVIKLEDIDLASIPEQTKIQGGLLASLLFASELFWPRPWPPQDQVLRVLSAEPLFAGDLGQMKVLRSFPTYLPKFLNGQYAKTSKPVLILAGERDREAPAELARKAAKSYSAANQHVVILPWATHGVLQSGPKSQDGRFCSVALRAAFLLNPDGPLDLACVGNLDGLVPTLPPLDARLPQEFGLNDSVWGD